MRTDEQESKFLTGKRRTSPVFDAIAKEMREMKFCIYAILFALFLVLIFILFLIKFMYLDSNSLPLDSNLLSTIREGDSPDSNLIPFVQGRDSAFHPGTQFELTTRDPSISPSFTTLIPSPSPSIAGVKCFPEAGSGLFENDKSIKKVVVDVGPHQTPMIPRDLDTGVILVEPNFHVYKELFDKFNDHPRIHLIHAALAGNPPRFSKFNIVSMDSAGSQSSSLAKPTSEEALPIKNVQITPTLPLSAVIAMIPESKFIELIKTDMQGFDLMGVRSAVECLHRVKQLKSEVWADGFNSYVGVENSLTEFKKTMESVGFDFKDCENGWTDTKHSMKELDCHWENPKLTAPNIV